jgi:hypothetical protein
VVADWLCSRKKRDLHLLDPKLFGAVAASVATFVITTLLDFSTFLSDVATTGAVYYVSGVCGNMELPDAISS